MRAARLARWTLEGMAVFAAYGLFRLLPLDWASALGGVLGGVIGPRLAVSRRAQRNLARAFPEKPLAELARIEHEMWRNLGRVAAEYAHLDHFRFFVPDSRVEVVGVEHVDRLRDDGVGGIFAAAHLGNWELPSVGAAQRGVRLRHIVREPNNPLVAWLLSRARAPAGGLHYPKGREGARAIARALARGEHIGLLVDQKFNEGIAVPFFGRPAMTAPALASLALRTGCPVLLARAERLGGARFRVTAYPPLRFSASGDKAADEHAVMARINALIEGWIRERPEQWLWLHRRWPE